MTTLRFRILLDNVEGVFRDIDIPQDATFGDLHEIIMTGFAFSGMEMASFYVSNEEWEKGEEISLMDLSEPGQDTARLMSETKLSDLVENIGDKLLYVYNFLNMWIFYVDLIQKNEREISSPEVVLFVGDAPAENSLGDANMDEFSFDTDSEFDDDLDFEESEGEFESLDDYPDL